MEQFWKFCEECAREVATWPAWKRIAAMRGFEVATLGPAPVQPPPDSLDFGE